MPIDRGAARFVLGQIGRILALRWKEARYETEYKVRAGVSGDKQDYDEDSAEFFIDVHVHIHRNMKRFERRNRLADQAAARAKLEKPHVQD